MRYLFVVLLAKAFDKLPKRIKIILKNSLGLNNLYYSMLDKHSSELSFQMRWAKAYNGKSEELKEALTVVWKKYRCLDEILKICHFNKEKNVLDVGCGIATVLHILEGKKYGLDPLGNEYKKIYKYPADLTIKHGHAEEIPFQDRFFDIVLCSNALDHTSNPKMALAEIKRVLNCDGFFVLVVEIRDRDTKRDLKHPHTFTLKSIRDLIDSEKFRIVFEKVMPWHGGVGSDGFIAVMKKE